MEPGEGGQEERDLSKGETTRRRILEIAEASVLAKGFGATSIDEVIAEAGITKSGFFYHFRDKNELAREMLLHYVETNDRLLHGLFERGCELTDDPLQALLVGLKLLAETMADLPNGHPGCLIASICYQERLYDRQVREIMSRSSRNWVEFFRLRLVEVSGCHAPANPPDLEQLATMMSCLVHGSIIMSKVLDDPAILPRQVLGFRDYIKLIFLPAAQLSLAA